MLPPDATTHTPRRLAEPSGWVLYLSHTQPERLVVFVHGFAGGAVDTWQRFPESGRLRGGWDASDMLYVRYDSRKESPSGVAARIRRALPWFYPYMPPEHIEEGGASVRPRATAPYAELLLVGHSLGGVIARITLSDSAQQWLEDREKDPDTPKPGLLDAKLRLFSPASAGIRLAGKLGMVHATPFWRVVNFRLRDSPAYTDLERGSGFLADIRRRTEDLIEAFPEEVSALRASIVWPVADDVVVPSRYRHDYVEQWVENKTHSTVCKPNDTYSEPWLFVETGKTE